MESQARSKIINDLIQNDFEYKKLHKEHMDLEEKLSDLDKQKYLSLEEERLRKELQKKKLSGKDTMEKMITKRISVGA